MTSNFKKVIIDERPVRVANQNRVNLTFDELCKVESALEDVKCTLVECYDYSKDMADEYVKNNIEHIKVLYIIDELNPYDTIDTIDNLI